jgi:hypothetical protein
MSHGSSSRDELLGSWGRRERIVEAFEEAWFSGNPPRLTDYLPAGGAERRRVLVELIRVDLEFRFKAKQSLGAEDYIGEYPELRDDLAAIRGVIDAECSRRGRAQGGALSPDNTPWEADADVPSPPTVDADATGFEDTTRPTTPPPGTDRPTIAGYEILRALGEGGWESFIWPATGGSAGSSRSR